MSHLDALLKYVRTGTTEGDKAFLRDVYVASEQLPSLVGIEPGGMRILVGNKGVGKSAIVELLSEVSRNRSLPCLLLRPDNLDTRDLPNTQDVGALKRHFFETLLTSISAQIGSQLRGLLTGEAAKLHQQAQQSGLAPQDRVQQVLTLLSAVSAPVLKINGVQLAKEISGTSQPADLIRAIQSHLLSKGSVFFLLIDDTDQVAAPGTAAHLNRIWALLLAVRRLGNECPSVRTIVTLRTEIWNRLVSESDGQRDQTDHLRGVKITLRASDKMIEDIIRRRLERAARDSGAMAGDPYPLFFAGTHVTLPTSIERRTWDSFLVKSSRERPRDAIQLIKNMIDRAKINHHQILGGAEAEEAMQTYSKERVDDLNNEFAPDCAAIRQVIGTFTDVEFESTFEKLREHINSVPSTCSVNLRGKVLQPQNDDDAILLLSLLHEAGFVNPRVVDNREPRGFRHILFQDDPNFVKMSNWNNMQNATWEIHPAFRTYLLAAKKDIMARAFAPAPTSDRSR